MNPLHLAPLWLRAAAENLTGTAEHIRFTAPVNITAAEAGADGKPAAGKRPKFTARAYDGSLMSLDGFYYPVILDLQGVKARKTVKILRDHDRSRVVGHATQTTVDSAGIGIAGVMSGSEREVNDIVDSDKAGFPWELSVGAQMLRREFLEAGKSTTVNGRNVTGPAIIGRESLVYETSFLAIGAAEQSSASIAATQTTSTNSSEGTSMTFEQWLQANGFTPAQVTDPKQRAFLEASYRAALVTAAAAVGGTVNGNPAPANQPGQTQTPAAAVQASAAGGTQPGTVPAVQANGHTDVLANLPAVQAAIQEGISAGYQRIARVQQICAAHGNPKIDVNGQQVDLQAHAIANNMDIRDVELNALRASRPSNGPFINVGSRSGGPEQALVVEASMCLSAGMSEEFVGEHFSEQVVNAAMERANRGIGIQQLIYASLAANGGYFAPGRMDSMTIEAALRCDPMLMGGPMVQASGGFSTLSLAGILSNLANKAMLERFAIFETAVPDFCWETDTNNFKAFTRYRLDGDGSFKEVGPDGELKHISLKESEYSNQLKTLGGMIALTRKMIIDDDLGAFMQIPAIFSELALHAREETAFTKLIGNAGNFFHEDNGNLITTALGLAGLDEAVAAFLTLKNAGGKFILARPDRVLVAPQNKATADKLHADTHIVTGSDVTVTSGNNHKGQYRPVVSPYLSEASGIAGADNDDWYLGCNPRTGMAPVQVGYLRGQRTPIIESAQADFKTLGVQWRSYWDFGCAQFEKNSMVKSNVA